MKLKLLVTIILLCQLENLAVYADTLGLGPSPIDTQALDNKRLFFSENQRQVGDRGVDKKELTAQLIESDDPDTYAANTGLVDLESNRLLHYTGSVHSERGVQLLLNGYPWLPGQLAIISARLQPDTQVIEIKTTGGAVYRLSPGDTVELKL